MNTIEMHLNLPSDLVQKMVSYSIHVIVEYNQAGSEIICRQICSILLVNPHGSQLE